MNLPAFARVSAADSCGKLVALRKLEPLSEETGPFCSAFCNRSNGVGKSLGHGHSIELAQSAADLSKTCDVYPFPKRAKHQQRRSARNLPMPKDQRSRDKKRRDKLAKKNQKQRRPVSLAYVGEKYKTDELIPLWMQTEIGIYEAFVITDRELVDGTVVTALERLIKKLRAGILPPLTSDAEIHYKTGQEEDLVIENIGRRWAIYFDEKWQPPRDKLIGVLRSILGSIEKARSPGQRSQSYLRHIAGFLTKKLGVSVQRTPADRQSLPEQA